LKETRGVSNVESSPDQVGGKVVLRHAGETQNPPRHSERNRDMRDIIERISEEKTGSGRRYLVFTSATTRAWEKKRKEEKFGT